MFGGSPHLNHLDSDNVKWCTVAHATSASASATSLCSVRMALRAFQCKGRGNEEKVCEGAKWGSSLCAACVHSCHARVRDKRSISTVAHCQAASSVLRWVAFIQQRLLAVTGMGMLRSLSQAEGSVRAMRCFPPPSDCCFSPAPTVHSANPQQSAHNSPRRHPHPSCSPSLLRCSHRQRNRQDVPRATPCLARLCRTVEPASLIEQVLRACGCCQGRYRGHHGCRSGRARERV
jgi:hypothetical protein